MSLYVVISPNGPYKRGTYVEEVENGMVQPVQMVADNGRWIPMYHYGIVLPLPSVRDGLLHVQSKGLDKSW